MNGCIVSLKKAPYAEIIGILAPAGGKDMHCNDGKPILEVSNSDDFFLTVIFILSISQIQSGVKCLKHFNNAVFIKYFKIKK